MRWRKWRLFLVPAIGLAVISQLAASASAGTTTVTVTAHAKKAASGAVRPKQVNELDCNGWSKKYGTVRRLAGDLCTDPIRITNGKAQRFTDNGWYIGHDEPSTKFISRRPGSGNTMTYVMKMSRDPAAAPTTNGRVVDYAQLSVAPWFGLPLCDPNSYPQNPCTPDSDTNGGQINDPNAAGSAFMELQFYPPGFTPFVDSTSCSATKWCAALTIDSLECDFKFATCNPNCEEPVNFAYLQTNGVPAGPPSPQLTDVSTFTPNRRTLMINPGDVVVASISDPPQGFTARVTDLTTHKTGWMTASNANGFMNTSIKDCTGTPFTFHAEYSSARQQNQVPWAALEGGVLMQQEIGHGEVCRSVANLDPVSASFPGGQFFTDVNTYDTCMGGSEGRHAVGEGPCVANVCTNATTQGPLGPVACKDNNPASGSLCEFADGFCFMKGTRIVLVNGVPARASARTNECYNNRYQNGDLDFDGQSYVADWPNGSRHFPTSFQYAGPFTAGGHTYPRVQFETDVGGSSNLCNVSTGVGCTAPPISAKFYPFWSLSWLSTHGRQATATLGGRTAGCVWNFGNDQPRTVADFGKDAQYGTPNIARYGGTIISAPLPNPEFAGRCRIRLSKGSAPGRPVRKDGAPGPCPGPVHRRCPPAGGCGRAARWLMSPPRNPTPNPRRQAAGKEMSAMAEVARIAATLVRSGKGVLAADESISTMNGRLMTAGVPATPEHRRAYREMLVTTPSLAEGVSGVILCDETFRQHLANGQPFPGALAARGLLPGITVDTGAMPLAGSPGETVTEGLDGLAGRLAQYADLGARFAKWRAVFRIDGQAPTWQALRANAHALTRYAALCHEAGLVPIVEPEVLMDGAHGAGRCASATGAVLFSLFTELQDFEVDLAAVVLTTNMVLPGTSSGERLTPEAVAVRTVRTLSGLVPGEAAGIAFLSGGQGAAAATANLAALQRIKAPWPLTFSFGRALADTALAAWRGDPGRVGDGQRSLANRVACNLAALRGGYRPEDAKAYALA